ncbi:unnamed protein product [Ranitomeya imitator]|uniref:UGGT thioredoxin-like domain-containing protein n=1 Tax=Ranitomeya imitator TaxID=111125 RepID=A0ABN9LA25_9NEOB|nr:unnamed protein product [Ranitomeya imitator]
MAEGKPCKVPERSRRPLCPQIRWPPAYTNDVICAQRGGSHALQGAGLCQREAEPVTVSGVLIMCSSMAALCFVLATCLCFSFVSADSKAVTTSLTTKWPSTSLLLEASEFLADDGSDTFWTFVDENQQVDQGSDSANYDLLLKSTGRLLSPVQQNLLKFALSLRSYSSAVQTFQQIASDQSPPTGCKAFVVVHGEKTCDLDQLPSLLTRAAERPKPFSLFKGDHRYPGASPPTVLSSYYTGRSAPENFPGSTTNIYRKGPELGRWCTSSDTTSLILKQKRSSSPVMGWKLAIKSTEYKAKDDTQVKGNDPKLKRLLIPCILLVKF